MIVNIARVLAKLSLYDTFRSQISSHRRYIESLVNVIHYEANTCRKIMNASDQQANEDEDDSDNDEDNNDGNDEEEDMTWPAWHTWPVISRISFTLGNLTTTNEANRTIIGTDMEGTGSILLLLQVCANSLSRINQQKQQLQQQKTLSVFQFASSASSTAASHPYVSLDEEDPGMNAESGKRRSSEDNEDMGYDIDQTAEIELRDAIIKLVRLLANLSIDSVVGMAVGSKYDNLQVS